MAKDNHLARGGMTLAELIQDHMERNGMSLQDLVDAGGGSPGKSRWATWATGGKNSEPSAAPYWKNVPTVAQALGVTEMTVVRAIARTQGLQVEDAESRLLEGMPAGTSILDDRPDYRDLVYQLIGVLMHAARVEAGTGADVTPLVPVKRTKPVTPVTPVQAAARRTTGSEGRGDKGSVATTPIKRAAKRSPRPTP